MHLNVSTAKCKRALECEFYVCVCVCMYACTHSELNCYRYNNRNVVNFLGIHNISIPFNLSEVPGTGFQF
jgi:hypothetical protein